MIRLAFPILALAIAIVLYLRRPSLYVGYTMWVWFLTPLVRRVVDLRYGWTDPNLVLLAPFLVASVSVLTVLLPNRTTPLRIPPTFVLCGMAILYGFVVGMLLHPSSETVYALFNWIAPLLFALHLALNGPHYHRLRRTVETNLVVGSGVMGAYGIFQFFAPPKWDLYWLENISAGLIDPSFGQPAPMEIRVWSTLNAPGPFANVMMAGLLLLFVTSSPLKVPSSIAGYISFLLAAVRTAWLGWMVGFIFLLRGENPRTIVKLILFLLLLAACLTPIIQHLNIAPVLSDRITSFSHLGQDESLTERAGMYEVMLGIVADNPVGHGLRNQEIVRNLVVDSGVLSVLLSLGWVGSAMYAGGIAVFLFGERCPPGDRFSRATKTICIAYLAQIFSGTVFVGVTGAIFWLCLGMSIAGGRWDEIKSERASSSPNREESEVNDLEMPVLA